MFKLALDAGHGRNTAGKRCHKSIDANETREWILNSRICEYIQKMLEPYSEISVERVDDVTGVTNVTLTNRTNRANHMKADFYLSIHHNAGVNLGSGGGIEAYVYTSVTDSTRKWQQDLYNSVINYTGLRGNRSQPLRSADLAVLRQTSMDAVLLECGYMDSTTDVPIILTDEFAMKVARGCTDVILAHAGVEKKPEYNYQGYVDGMSTNQVFGWAWNGKNDIPCEVHVYIYKDGKEVGMVPGIMASSYREDLKKNGIGNGSHGFNLDIDLYSQFGAGAYTVKAYVIGGGNPQLIGEPKATVEQLPPPPEAVPNDTAEQLPPPPEAVPTDEAEQSLPPDTVPENPVQTDLPATTEATGILSLLKKLLLLIIKKIFKFGGKS